MNRLFVIAVIASLSAVVAQPASAVETCRYSLTDLGYHPLYNDSSCTNPNGMNASGQVVGIGFRSGSANSRAFLYSDGTMIDLGMLSGYTTSCTATAINDDGVVVGYSEAYPAYSGPVRAFVYHDGTMTALGTLGGTKSRAYGINDLGQIVGMATLANSSFHAFLLSDGTMQDLGTFGGASSAATGINATGQVCGYASTSARDYHAFVYDNESLTDLGTFGGSDSQANAINLHNQVVGFAYLPGDAAYHAFVYSGGTKIDLGTFGGTYSGAEAINDHGQVVGFSQIPGDQARAFLYENGTVTDLNDLIDPAWDFTLFGATAINNSGQIAAYGKYGTDVGNPVRTVLLTPIPEPSCLVLLGASSIVVLAFMRRWTQAAKKVH